MRISKEICPNCKSRNTEINILEYDLSHNEKIIIFSFLCKDCGLRFSDIIPEYFESNETEIKILSRDDLKKKIYKFPNSLIILKEVNIEIKQISQSKFFIYTVDGFLYDIISFLENLKKIEKDKIKIIDKKIKYLTDVINGEKPLTIIIKKIIS